MNTHLIPDGGDPSQGIHHQACHRDSLVGGKAKTEELVHLIDAHAACQLDAAIRPLLDFRLSISGFVR